MKKITFMFFCAFTGMSFAQVGIGTTTPAAALEINSTNNGILIPRVALTGKDDSTTIVNPVGGGIPVYATLVFNTADTSPGANAVTPGFYYWNTSNWVFVGNDPTTVTSVPNGGTGATTLLSNGVLIGNGTNQ